MEEQPKDQIEVNQEWAARQAEVTKEVIKGLAEAKAFDSVACARRPPCPS